MQKEKANTFLPLSCLGQTPAKEAKFVLGSALLPSLVHLTVPYFLFLSKNRLKGQLPRTALLSPKEIHALNSQPPPDSSLKIKIFHISQYGIFQLGLGKNNYLY